MELVSCQYRIGERNNCIELSPEKPLELNTDEFELLLGLIFSPDSLSLQPDDSASLTFQDQDGTKWTWQYTVEGEGLWQDEQPSATFIDLAHLIAVKWGVSSAVQFRNLLLAKQGKPTQPAVHYLNKTSEIEEIITDLINQTSAELQSEVNCIRGLHRQIAQINGVRRLLWAKVCKIQEQMEKFSATMQGVIGTPIKPEDIFELQEKKDNIAALGQKIADLESETAKLMPHFERYRRFLSALWLGLATIVLGPIGWYFRLLPAYPALGLSMLGLVVSFVGVGGYRLTKRSADRYFDCQDQLLDSKTELRRAKKDLKAHLSGTDEAELLKKFAAQQEAERIRTDLDYRLDRYTKAWQSSNTQSLQARLVEATTRVFTLCQQEKDLDTARKLSDRLSERQRLVVEVEAATFREKFFIRRGTDESPESQTPARNVFAEMLIPSQAPAVWFGGYPGSPNKDKQIGQIMVVR